MSKQTVYLDKRRDVDLMRYLQRLQRLKGGVVVIRHRVLADKIGVSESTVRRAVKDMVEAGHITRGYIKRPSRGGHLCMYRVNLDVIYRKGSFFRQAKAKFDQLQNDRNDDDKGGPGASGGSGGEALLKNNDNNKLPHDPSPVNSVDKQAMSALLQTARLLGIDDRQRGYLRGAALRYGVYEAWRALEIAVQEGRYRICDLSRIVWGILRKWYPRGVAT